MLVGVVPHVVGVLAANLLVVVLINQFAPASRAWNRTWLFPFGLYLLSVAAWLTLSAFLQDGWVARASSLTSLLELLLVINAAGAALFDVLLPRIGILPPGMVREVTIGGVFLALSLYTLQSAGAIDTDKLFASTALITIVLGLALQSTLGNVVAALALQMDNSIHLGDRVRV